MKVIGITGTNGAGKGTVVQLLQKQFPNIIHRSARDIIKRIAESRGVQINNREDLTHFANQFTAIEGNSFFKSFIEENISSNDWYILESIRRISEVESMRSLLKENFLFLAVDASPDIRHKRVSEGRQSETDLVSFEEFVRQEQLEQNTDDNKKQNLNGCIKISDFIITNNGSFEELEKQVQQLAENYRDFFPQQQNISSDILNT